ncbi:MAG: DUF4827 family protein [Bacteroidales bacterium]|nr:DUF4827 family protein [Bacteroidales bacterium]
MRKIFIFLNLLLLGSIIFTSCDNTKTYAQLLAEEKSAIAKLIADSFIVIPFNKDSLYTKQNKHIMQLSNGLYLAIISKGNMLDTARLNVTKVTYRFKGLRFVNDTIYEQNIHLTYPAEFIYGQQSTDYGLTFGPTNMACEAVQTPLKYVGNGGVVKLVIPSKINFSNYQRSVQPIYIQELKYTFSVQN